MLSSKGPRLFPLSSFLRRKLGTRPPPSSENELRDLLQNSASPDERIFSSNQEPFISKTYSVPKSRSSLQSHQVDQREASARREEDHSECSSLLFPGQGMQYVGMGSSLFEKEKEVPIIGSLFDRASHILNYDLRALCLEGPEEELNRTVHCQPATFVSSLAAVEYLFSTSPNSVKKCISTAGFSVGEFAALVFSGALTFDDGLRLVKVRAEEMQRCSEMESSGMMSIFFGTNNEVSLALQVAQKWLKEKHKIDKPVVVVANHMYSMSKVIAGHLKALEFIDSNKEDFKIRKTKFLPVSGAFHTSLMKDALPLFEEQLAKTQIHNPKIPVFSNLDGRAYQSANEIRKKLPKQIIRPIKWEQTMNTMFKYEDDAHLPSIIEVGPGRSLSYILRKINGKASKKSSNVKV